MRVGVAKFKWDMFLECLAPVRGGLWLSLDEIVSKHDVSPKPTGVACGFNVRLQILAVH